MYLFKQILFLSLLSISLFACKTKIPQKGDDVLIFDDNDNDNNKEDSTDIVVINPIDTAIFDTIIIEDTLSQVDSSLFDSIYKKDVYNVAVILPFDIDSVRRAWSNAKEIEDFDNLLFNKESESSISFIEGMFLALDDIKLDSRFNIKIYDNSKSLTKTESIIETIKIENNTDIIIGPISKTNIVQVSNFAIENKIVHISPFSPSKSASQGNPFYYMVEPSLEQHIINMIDYSIDSINNSIVKFVHHDNEIGNSYASLVKNYIDYKNSLDSSKAPVGYELIPLKGARGLSNYVTSGMHNVFIVNSFNEDFLHVFLRYNKKIGGNSNITIFGMPGWERSEIIRLEYLNSSNVHFTTTNWYDENNKNTITFDRIYKSKYKTKPSEDAQLGYDITSIFFKIIDKNGLLFDDYFVGYKFDGISRSYLFKQVLNNENKINRVENSNLRIYKIEEFERVLVK